jgi:hypothetical protein
LTYDFLKTPLLLVTKSLFFLSSSMVAGFSRFGAQTSQRS